MDVDVQLLQQLRSTQLDIVLQFHASKLTVFERNSKKIIKVEILEGQSLGYSRNSSSTSEAAKPSGTFAIAIDLQFPRFALSYGGRGDFSYPVQRYKNSITLKSISYKVSKYLATYPKIRLNIHLFMFTTNYSFFAVSGLDISTLVVSLCVVYVLVIYQCFLMESYLSLSLYTASNIIAESTFSPFVLIE